MGQRISNAAYLLVSQSILSVAIHDLAGWEPAGESLYHALGRDALEKEGIPVLRRNIMEQKRQPYLSVGIDIGADFSLMAIALPIQEIIGKPYKILHSSNRSVQGAVERILSTGRAYELPVRVYMESTGIYHLPLYHRLKDAGLDVYVLNPLVTHANQNINIRNIHNDKLDARRIALLGLRPDLKTSIVPADEVAAVKALLREYHAMKKETSMYFCRLKNQLRQIFPQYLPLFSKVNGKASLEVLSRYPSPGAVLSAGADALAKLIREASEKGAAMAEKKAEAILSAARESPSLLATETVELRS